MTQRVCLCNKLCRANNIFNKDGHMDRHANSSSPWAKLCKITTKR